MRDFDQGPRLGAVLAVLTDRAVKARGDRARFLELSNLIDALEKEFPEEAAAAVPVSGERREATAHDVAGLSWTISIPPGADLRTPRHSAELVQEVFFDVVTPPLPTGTWCVVDYDGWRYVNCPVELISQGCARIRVDLATFWDLRPEARR